MAGIGRLTGSHLSHFWHEAWRSPVSIYHYRTDLEVTYGSADGRIVSAEQVTLGDVACEPIVKMASTRRPGDKIV
jgi:hypothetical protein